MSLLRALASSALSLLVPASLVLVSGPGSATGTSIRTTLTQTVHLVVLPPIVQPGGRVAAADEAKAALTATFAPVRAGRPISLQAQSGTSWKTVATVAEDAHGRAQFAAPSSRDGEAVTYRAVAAAFGGLPAIESRRASTERWLTPTWGDEFSGTALSSSWTYRGKTYEPQSFRACSRGGSQAVSVGGGALRLSVIKDPSRSTKCPALKNGQVAGYHDYRLNGHVGTDQSFSFRYGVAAARIKYPALRGQHGSFWMQPVGGMRPGSTGHEIDVTEFFGRVSHRSGLFSYIHRYQGGRIVKTGANIPDSFLHGPRDGWGRNFHVFSVQWTPRTLIFRVDGKESWRVGGRVSQVPEYLILSLLSSDYELPLIRDDQLPQHMYVDWVRVWQTGG